MEAYKQRMVNEYRELKERTDKLGIMLDRWLFNDLDFEPSCPFELLDSQFHVMKVYLSILKQRAGIENIDLDYDFASDPKEEEKSYRMRHKLTGEYLCFTLNKSFHSDDLNWYTEIKRTQKEWEDMGYWDNNLYEPEEVLND